MMLSSATDMKVASSCGELTRAQPPSALLGYKNYSTPPRLVLAESSARFKSELDPANLRADPELDLSCPEVQLVSVSADSCDSVMKADGTRRPSIFSGDQPLYLPFEGRVRSEAIACGLPADAFIASSRDAVTSAIMLGSCPDDGRICNLIPPPPGDYVKVAGGPFAAGMKPDLCLPSSAACYPKLSGYTNVSSEGESLIHLEDSALTLAKQEFAAFFPRANFNCTGGASAYCTSFESKVDTSVLRLKGSVKVPLYTIGALSNGPIEVSYSNSRTWEGEYAR